MAAATPRLLAGADASDYCRVMRFVARALVLTALAGVPACHRGGEGALTAAEYQANAEAAYAKAMRKFHKRDWPNAMALMDDVKREYAGTTWARLAQLRIADAQFKQGEYAEAITAYREFLRDFPSDENVPYARYQVISCQFESRGDGVMSPPLEERDLANVHDAAQSIEAFLRDYPNYPELERILYMQDWVRGMLARHELYVARFYLGKSNFDAAVARTEYALTTYKDTGLEPEALVLLGEIRLKQGELGEARTVFMLVRERFPDSPFREPAIRFLKQMDDSLAAKTGRTRPDTH